jgi:hypothetical protein
MKVYAAAEVAFTKICTNFSSLIRKGAVTDVDSYGASTDRADSSPRMVELKSGSVFSRSRLLMTARLLALMACLCAIASVVDAAGEKPEGWQLERGVELPSYAVIEPARTNLNIDTVALVCEEAAHRNFLQLQIYLLTEDQLPNGFTPLQPKADSRAELVIDGRAFPVGLLFAGHYIVLADAKGVYPRLSEPLLDAMEAGGTMVLRFDLVSVRAGQSAAFDGEAVVNLQAGVGGAAVAIVRRCAGPTLVATSARRWPGFGASAKEPRR